MLLIIKEVTFTENRRNRIQAGVCYQHSLLKDNRVESHVDTAEWEQDI